MYIKAFFIIITINSYQKALKHYEEGKFPEAFCYFNKILAVNPTHVEALVSRGTL